YDFIFKRKGDLYSKRRDRTVSTSEACKAPSSELIALMECATNPPEDDDYHRHFSKWGKTAYVDELRIRPEEEASGELAHPGVEQFRQLVRGGIRTVVSLGENYDRGKEGSRKTEVEKKPLIYFARSFA